MLPHGDRSGSRGGQGFIGPAATIARGMKKVRDYYAALGKPLYRVLVGHFHTCLDLGELGYANGSLPGVSEYSRDFRMGVGAPVQWLFYVHPEWGVTAQWKVMLEKQPRLVPASGDFSEFGG